MSDLYRAGGGFVRGFARARSVSYPRVVDEVGDLWVVRDEPVRAKGRVCDVVGVMAGPEKFLEVIRAEPQERWSVCRIDGELDKRVVPDGFKAAGFRRNMMLPLFFRELDGSFQADDRIRRVLDRELVERVRKAGGGGRLLENVDLEDGPNCRRLYAAIEEGELMGWVASVPVPGEGAYVVNLYVEPEVRGRGLGSALMTTMLADDFRHGVKWSCLSASEDGTRLYPKVGYQQVGTMQFFWPPKYRSRSKFG